MRSRWVILWPWMSSAASGALHQLPADLTARIQRAGGVQVGRDDLRRPGDSNVSGVWTKPASGAFSGVTGAGGRVAAVAQPDRSAAPPSMNPRLASRMRRPSHVSDEVTGCFSAGAQDFNLSLGESRREV
jgi:hypothetical protein